MWNKKTAPRILRKLFTGIEILLVVAVISAGTAGFSSWKNKRELNNAAGKNAEQAVVIDKLVNKVEQANKEKGRSKEVETNGMQVNSAFTLQIFSR